MLGRDKTKLPAGQYELDEFPRFGLSRFAKRFPKETRQIQLKITGDVDESITVSDELRDLPRFDQTSDFHCVTTWTRRSLRWSGFRFCDLLLSQGHYQEARKRATQTLVWATQEKFLLEIALDKLSLGHAFMLEEQAGGSKDFSQASRDYLNQAVQGLREAGTQHHLPRALFARALLYRLQGEFAPAWADLEEAREIAERGEMKLYLADYHLEACRLEIKEQKANGKRQAEEHLNIAKEMIEKMGYGRRKPEVEALRRELEELEGKTI